VPKKKTARMKHVASFPSTYHEIHDMLLTWVTPQGKWPTRWCRATYKDKTWGNEALGFVPVSILLGLDGVLTWITPGDTVVHARVHRGVVDTPPHSN